MDNENLIVAHSTPQPRHHRLGIALSGGGARGFAHAGALKALEEAGLKPDVIAGVSAGSVVAVMYAAGVSPDNILDVFTNSSFRDYVSFSFGKGAIFDIKKFRDFIIRNIKPYTDLSQLPIPTYIGVTDFDNGEPAEFHDGFIGDRMLASCSIPIVFKPVTINGTRYVDGGVMRNMPSWIIRDKCDFLIGINVSPMKRLQKTDSIIDVAMHTFNLMSKVYVADDSALCDMCVETQEISYYKVFNLKEIRKVFNSGYLNMRKALREAGMWKSGIIPVKEGNQSNESNTKTD